MEGNSAGQKKRSTRVFVSAKSEDYETAKRVYDFLRSEGLDVFFADESLPARGNSDYRNVIDHALDEAEHMVVVGTSRSNIESPWVEAEWGFFINEKRSKRKLGNLVTVVAGGVKAADLPPSLRCYEVLECSPSGFTRLRRYIKPEAECVIDEHPRVAVLPGANPADVDSRLQSPVFVGTFYLEVHDDLKRAFGQNVADAGKHWLAHGITEGRRSSPAFDVRYYLENHPDLVRAFGPKNYERCLRHWVEFGITEGRRTADVFDVRYYLATHADLVKAFGPTGWRRAIEHWLSHGVNEGRQGSPDFHSRFYLSDNPDVFEACGPLNFLCAMLHWIKFGRRKGRKGAP